MIEELRDVLSGRLVTPADPDWGTVRPAWNLTVDQQPLAVVEAAGPSDVEHAVAYAAAHGLKVAAQAGGHGATRALDNTIVVRTNALDDVWVDSHARIARVGAGVRWGTLQSALDGTGLTGLPGSNGDISVVGYCVGGGLSWFSRPYGSGANSLRAAEIVDGAGARRWIDDSTDPDLMWALRGGGGNLAVVTSVEVELHPAPAIVGGRLMFPIEEAAAVLTAYAKATPLAPEQVTLWAYLAHYPPAMQLPEAIRGKSFCMIDAAAPYEPEALEEILAPIRAAGTVLVDTIGPLQSGDVVQITQEPLAPAAIALTTSTFDELTPELVATLLEYAGQPSLIFQVQLRHLRASEEVRHPGIASADPQAQYMLLAASVLPVPELLGSARQALAALKEAVSPWHAGDLPPTGLSSWGTLQDSFTEPDLARLREVKQRVDPMGTLIGNYPLP
ncbi:FAD-binding oxidoreductase [Kribbella sandramycini]|uniref:FAD-binding oxidoreductase n=1 Tax=Kribbella sandramycini TaxID=60450 RepID=A0A7Y4P1P1_9ACTN|nr:FAD-binding oxidoreductase [Kribbella sandramycini]MBB6571837.1 FAD/FMN-containing dehydrogenase [Kribbella sandramycini]NOL44477.1 FAD-binding oxidoreductase [Kribbella sandramycini]